MYKDCILFVRNKLIILILWVVYVDLWNINKVFKYIFYNFLLKNVFENYIVIVVEKKSSLICVCLRGNLFCIK